MDKLLNMLSEEEFEKVLVFGETKFGVQRLSDHLEQSGLSSVAIHGNKSQSQRQRALKTFKDGRAKILVATDVAARGLDIPNVSHVINFDQPATYEDYVHRIGRTGRGGASGKAYTFVAPQTRR
ncbi:MAG: C-terminal helicase domain-containing protein [Candidatus Microsaccharimonas sp.]